MALPYAQLVERDGEALHVELVDSSGEELGTIRVVVDVREPARWVSRSSAIDAFIPAPMARSSMNNRGSAARRPQ